MKETILSIITVNFNNNRGLINTLESVKQQSFTSYEHIIIDANSSDGSKETIIQYAKETTHLTYWISEPDNGIYYGMNKGIEQAHGEYLYFLNSGDCLKEDVLSQIQFDGTQYIYCDITVILPDNYKLQVQYPDHINTALLLIRDTFCHQACFIHHSLCNHTIFRHANFIGCLSADKIKMPVRKYFCFNIPVYRNMAEEPSCRSPYHEEYIQTSVSGNSEGLCRSTYSFLSERR